jgi:hypothetical protein
MPPSDWLKQQRGTQRRRGVTKIRGDEACQRMKSANRLLRKNIKSVGTFYPLANRACHVERGNELSEYVRLLLAQLTLTRRGLRLTQAL